MRLVHVFGTTEIYVANGDDVVPRVRAWLDAHAPPSPDERDTIARAYAGTADGLPVRPLRWPHHTTSPAGILGSQDRPGEVHLATCGALVLLDAPLFSAHVLRELPAVLRRGASLERPAAPLAVVLA